MRLQRLDLIKYGKFSDRSIEFPTAPHDFHLIVGPNEAGKSTLRAAIVDLLFGIPARSVHNFLHPLNELRLGASISNSLTTLDFHRTKALKQTLRTPLDGVLPDTALSAFLGTADRHFFDQMFGLDHDRLVSGGNSILNAKNDIGQILFQSAAGVASLGKIRDALSAEADKLWAPRKSSDRAYYIAAEQFEKATAALKDATVRTKVWVEANSRVEELQTALENEQRNYIQLQSQRATLERIRRISPFLLVLRETEHSLADLGDIIELPIEAAETLSTAEKTIAIGRERLAMQQEEVVKLSHALEAIRVDETLLGRAADIKQLDELRLQYSAYEKDIGHRKIEKELLWQGVCQACAQLGWPPESETAISQRLPTLLIQRELRQLIRQYGGIVQAVRSAELAEATKHVELESVLQQLDGIQITELSPALRVALANANALGQAESSLQKQQSIVAKAKRALDALLHELGPWTKPLAELMAMQLPSPEQVARWSQERQDLFAEHKAELIQLQKQHAEVSRMELLITQFTALHHPVTFETVLQARRERDALWAAIKSAERELSQDGPAFEAAIVSADTVADRRTDNVEQATELQNLLHQQEREQQKLLSIEQHCADLEKHCRQFDERWTAASARFGLIAMALDAIGAWMIKRDKVLAAALVYQEAQHDYDALATAVSAAASDLAKELRALHLEVSEIDSLAVLCSQVDHYIHAVERTTVRYETLAGQVRQAKTQQALLKQSTADAKAEQMRWAEQWIAILKKAGLPPDSDTGSVEGTLELISDLAEKLEKMRQIQVERIDAMHADLNAFSNDVTRLVAQIAPELKDEPANQCVIQLLNRLTKERELQAERERLRSALHTANDHLKEAHAAIQTAEANLKPLLERAGVDTHALLLAAINRSDHYRRLSAELADAQQHFLSGGDGLTRSQLEAEVAATNLVQLAAECALIEEALSNSVERQSALSAELATAARILADIGGSDAAAQAEAQRQEALAKMADTAERYIKVFIAVRLLRWSIERYREEKQGPLLERASTIFATLTSGSFRKLIVDFDQEPMVLEGLRSDGKPVGISGLSDGTRDQLYLALRLAALELHLEQATPLPFIADDLFINYDDVRSKAGFDALKQLSEHTQVIFLSHHDHLIPTVQAVFGQRVNIIAL